MDNIKKNLALIIGLFIPVLMVFIILGLLYLPSRFFSPKHDFLYTLGNTYDYNNKFDYSIQNGRLIRQEILRSDNQTYKKITEGTLYLHNVTANQSRAVTIQEAQRLNLANGVKSPDGFEIVQGKLDENYHYTWYLRGHFVAKKLNVQPDFTFHFVGWVR